MAGRRPTRKNPLLELPEGRFSGRRLAVERNALFYEDHFQPQERTIVDKSTGKEAIVGEATNGHMAMDLAQAPLMLRGAARQDTRQAINRVAIGLISSNCLNPLHDDMHARVRTMLESNPNVGFVRVRKSRKPLGSFVGPVVVELVKPNSAMEKRASKHYQRHGYGRHRTGEGELVLSRKDILSRPFEEVVRH